MRRRSTWILALAAGSAGCTSSLTPVAVPLSANPPRVELCAAAAPKPATAGPTTIYADVAPRDRLRTLVCALHAKSAANLDQAQRWANRTEWRDIPLIGAATTVAGLLLFGKRDGDNRLTKGDQEAISIAGFGAASFATFANYLSPERARTLLRQGARGHYCLATQGELVLSVYDSVERAPQRAALKASLADLTARLASDPKQFALPEEARLIRQGALKALTLYDTQMRQLDTAAVSLGETSWNFGIDLLSRSDRGEQKVDALVKAITEQTESTTRFASTEQRAADPVPPAKVQGFLGGRGQRNLSPGPDQVAADVARDTALLIDGLVNVEALVLGFDKCAATALAGGTPRADRIQRATLQ